MRPAAPRSAFDGHFPLDDDQAHAADALSLPGEQGVYLCGPVGRGKTWLLDRYFDAVETEAKSRVHFHEFFRELHAAYFRHGFSIDRAVDEMTDGIDLLCFDEFHVHDIGDGRLIARMLDSLFARKVALVLTSNYRPEELMPNPLFHAAFSPTITVIEAHLDVIMIDGRVDYRSWGRTSSRFATGTWTTSPSTDGLTFDSLCCAPKSTGDYLDLVDRINGLTITDVPAMQDMSADAAQRFSNLVDVLYDRDLPTYFHARVGLDTFADQCSGLDIDRIVSRLSELADRGPESAGQSAPNGVGAPGSQ